MTERTGWKCEACLCCGMLSHDEHASVYEVINFLEDVHRQASPACALNLSNIRVWKIPAPAARETQETNDG